MRELISNSSTAKLKNCKTPQLQNSSTAKLQIYNSRYFIYIYILLFIYYIIATSFFGHYQERYRMPVMVCFIIPITAVFISDFDLKNYLKKPGIYIRSAITILVLVIWIFQAKAAIANKDRFDAALEQAEKSIGNK
jgi:hypothetical protein